MKVFISSLIAGVEPIRQAARNAVITLRHQSLMAEDFRAKTLSPQIACLNGIRQSDLVVFILGAEYGGVQPSRLSATHEEYREARGRKPILAFVQNKIVPDPMQAQFIEEVQGWKEGYFREGFANASDLQSAIIRALHEYELANAVGPVDPEEIARRAVCALPTDYTGFRRSRLRSPAVHVSKFSVRSK